MSIQFLTEVFVDRRVNITITQICRELFMALNLENGWKYKFCYFILLSNMSKLTNAHK